MNFLKRKNKKGNKIVFYYDHGRKKGQRPTTGVFVYTNPKNQTEKNHNKQPLSLIGLKKSQLTIEKQAVGTAYIQQHKFKSNFLDYYTDYVKAFMGKDFVAPIEISENLCKRFRRYLPEKYTGETPPIIIPALNGCWQQLLMVTIYRIQLKR